MASAPSTSSDPRRFTFDTVFDGDRVIAPVRNRVAALTADDVEAARAHGFAQGESSAIARAEAAAADAAIAAQRDIHAALGALKAMASEHRAAAASLALACGRAIAGAAVDRAPSAMAEAALAALTREIEAQPRLAVRASREQAGRLQEVLATAAEAAGFAGQVTVRPDPGLDGASFSFDWGEGRAHFDLAAASVRVEAALAGALAAEALHAEPFAPDLFNFEREPS